MQPGDKFRLKNDKPGTYWWPCGDSELTCYQDRGDYVIATTGNRWFVEIKKEIIDMSYDFLIRVEGQLGLLDFNGLDVKSYAEKLANENPGKTITIYKRVGECVVNPGPVEWKNYEG